VLLEDIEQALYACDAAEYLTKRTSIPFTPQTLSTLAAAGRGPRRHNSWSGPLYDPVDLDRWIDFHLRSPFNAYELRDRPPLGDRARWLHVQDSDYRWHHDYVQAHFEAWGCDVLSSATPIGACVTAGRAEFHAALIEMHWNAEAGVIIADILGTRRIPFIFATRLRDAGTDRAGRDYSSATFAYPRDQLGDRTFDAQGDRGAHEPARPH
jgi:hypothetical protein